MTSTRYWAPSGPHLGPDEFDRRLLTPGNDAELDLGAALLAAHRVGAAACQVAADTPLLNDNTVAVCMASARLALADPMVDCVSKSVEGTSYGALLVRDVLDAAERGVLAVFRSAVAKGVAPPVAATRAAAIYGCPTEELGRYRALASDPRAVPAALTDAADRALWATVSRLAREEAVSKIDKVAVLEPDNPRRGTATLVRPDDPATPYFDARSADGRFAAVGTTTRTSTLERLRAKLGLRRAEPEQEVATEPATEPATRPATRRRRKVRQRRRVRSPEQQVGTTPVTRPVARQKVSTLLRAKPTAQQRALLRSTRTQTADDDADSFDPSWGGIGPSIPDDVLAKPYPDDTGIYHQLEDSTYSYVLPEREAKAWLKAMEIATRSAGTRMVRIGHLMDEYENPLEINTNQYEDRVDEVIRDADAGDLPTVVQITKAELDAEGTKANQEALIERRMDEMSSNEDGVINYEIRDAIRDSPDLATGGILLVHFTRRPPTVYHLEFSDPVGRDYGSVVQFDPNTPYRATAKRFDDERWIRDDLTKDYVRHITVHFAPTSEDTVAAFRRGEHWKGEKRLTPVGKATAVLDRQERSVRARHQPRDERGQFSETGQITGTDAETLRRLYQLIPQLQETRQSTQVQPKRQVRQRRKVRQRRGTANEQQVAVQPKQGTLARQMARNVARTAVARARATQKSTLVIPKHNDLLLDPSSYYRVLSPTEWKKLQVGQSGHAMVDPEEILVHAGLPNASLLINRLVPGTDEARQQLTETYIGAQDYLDNESSTKSTWSGDDGTPGGRYDLLEHIRSVARKPNVGTVSAIRSPHPTHPGRYQWTLYTNISKPPTITVVEYNPDVSFDSGRTHLQLTGKATYALEEHLGDGVIVEWAIPVLHYKATNWNPDEQP